MSTQETICAVVAAGSICVNLILLNFLLDANRVLNWHIRLFQKKPWIVQPPERSKWHRRFLKLITFPAPQARAIIRQNAAS